MGESREIVRYRKERDNRIIEVVIWHVSEQVPGSSHSFKYRLYYGTDKGACIVRYDNERGKGDHRHLGEREEPYLFISLARLVEDFEADVERM